MDSRYNYHFAAAYYRGRAMREGRPMLDEAILKKPLDQLTEEEMERIVSAGCEVEDKLYYFKNTHDEMARIRRVLGFLRSVQFETLLDVGSGRGVFLLPFLSEFPWVRVTSADILPHRVRFWEDLRDGGIAQVTPMLADITAMPLPEKSRDVVTLLEVLEHIPQVEKAIEAAVMIARKHVVVTVPSKPDNNPEHIHLLTKDKLTAMFAAAGCTRLRFDGVNGHLFMVATIGT